jgi:hypothetical protein
MPTPSNSTKMKRGALYGYVGRSPTKHAIRDTPRKLAWCGAHLTILVIAWGGPHPPSAELPDCVDCEKACSTPS